MAVLGLGVLSAFGVRSLFLLWNDLGAISSALGHHAIVAIIALKLAFFLTVALHQLVHALACVHYGRRVKEVGFIIHHLVVPTFYADVTDLFMPTVAVPPFEVGRPGLNEIDGQPVPPLGWMPFTFPFNLTGQPAATVPVGMTSSGLPVGLQIVGRRFADRTVLAASAAFEAARPWAERRPAIG